MRTLQEKYNAVLEGNFSKEQFRRDAVMQLPNLVSKFNSFEDMTTILKNRGMLAEAKKEEVTAYKKPEVETADLIAPDLLDDGIKAELEAAGIEGTPSEEEYEKAKEKAAKNLAKDPLCYKNAQTMPEMGEKMEKAKLHEETALDRAEDNAARKVQNKLGDIADTVAEKPASVAAAFRKMVLANPTHYAKMSAHELEQEFNKFKLEEANRTNTTDFASTPEEREDGTYDISGIMGEAETANTLADILKNKGTLDHLKKIERLRLKLIDGPFLKKNPDWKDKAVKFIRYDAREGLVLIDLGDTSGFAYPSELVIDTQTTNMMEDVRTQLKEALNKDIKAFGQDLDKAFKAAGFSTLVIMQPATPEQLNIVKTNPKAVLFEVSQNAEAQTLTVFVNPTQIQKAESIINKFQLSDFNGPVLKKGWTAKQVQGAINSGDIVKQDADKGRGMWYFYRLAKVDTKVKTLAEINVSGEEQKDQEKQLKEAVKALIKKTLEA